MDESLARRSIIGRAKAFECSKGEEAFSRPLPVSPATVNASQDDVPLCFSGLP